MPPCAMPISFMVRMGRSRSGGTEMVVRGPGIMASEQLTICFVKGDWREEVRATFDAASGSASKARRGLAPTAM